jgi:CRP-like cAMP-binding protein
LYQQKQRYGSEEIVFSNFGHMPSLKFSLNKEKDFRIMSEEAPKLTQREAAFQNSEEKLTKKAELYDSILSYYDDYKEKRITIRDVAEWCGTSQPTVSRVFSGQKQEH